MSDADPTPGAAPPSPPSWEGRSYSWQPASSPPPWPPRRRKRPLLLVLSIAALVLIAGGVGAAATLLTRSHSGGSNSPSQASPSPTSAANAQARALYQRALAAMRSTPGFHYVAVTEGPLKQRIEGDAGQAIGSQLITFNSTFGAEQFTLLLSNGTVYFQGNTPALQDQLGVGAGAAPGLVGKWISVVRGDGPYNVLQPGITATSQADETALVPASMSQVSRPDGTRATRITGTVPAQNGAPAGSGYIDVATTSGLPLEYVTSISASGITLTSTATFTKWGSAPSVTAPSSATAWSTLGASEPPGGYGNGGNGAGPSQTPPVSV